MKEYFFNISEKVINTLSNDEHLTISINGENSEFIRINNAKVRQIGTVADASMGMELIKNNRKVQMSFTIQRDMEKDYKIIIDYLDTMRKNIVSLPEDPLCVLPENHGSLDEEYTGHLLNPKESVDALLPVMNGVDLIGIWASGDVFVGNTNSAGQKNWFSTETFSLDYLSLIHI